jgi:RNA polymerase sigma-70 factor (ECF subfamily)
MDTPLRTSEKQSAANQTRWFADEVQPNEPLLRAWLGSRFPSLHDLDDLVQESYLRLLRARARCKIRSAKAFLFAVARNLAINQLARGRHEDRRGLGESDVSTVLDEAASVPESVALAQELEMLTQAIQSLPKRCREAFILHRLYGLTRSEVAVRLSISESTVDGQCIIALRKVAHYFRRTDRPTTSVIAADRVPDFGRKSGEKKFRVYA